MIPTTLKPNGNQYYLYDIPTIPFCLDDYDLVRGNNNEGEAKVLSPEGNESKILSLKWNFYSNKARIKYAESKLYTDNLKESLIENEGN
jgi:hypothetical protein